MSTTPIVAVLQARCSSSRLASKILTPLAGKPMVLHQMERIGRASSLTGLVLATSGEPSDDVLQELCDDNGIACFRGSLDDVLDRCYRAVLPYQPHHVVRLTGD